jgi:hypothetical protein
MIFAEGEDSAWFQHAPHFGEGLFQVIDVPNDNA